MESAPCVRMSDQTVAHARTHARTQHNTTQTLWLPRLVNETIDDFEHVVDVALELRRHEARLDKLELLVHDISRRVVDDALAKHGHHELVRLLGREFVVVGAKKHAVRLGANQIRHLQQNADNAKREKKKLKITQHTPTANDVAHLEASNVHGKAVPVLCGAVRCGENALRCGALWRAAQTSTKRTQNRFVDVAERASERTNERNASARAEQTHLGVAALQQTDGIGEKRHETAHERQASDDGRLVWTRLDERKKQNRNETKTKRR